MVCKDKKCKNCKWCTWSCPGYMCMNPNHPKYQKNSDTPISIDIHTDYCDHFEYGNNDYSGFLSANI